MRTDEKQYYAISEELKNKLIDRGYRQVAVEDEPLFDTYYDKMNAHWSSSTCVCNMICWQDTFPTFFKEADGMLLCLNYVSEDGVMTGIPMIGEYTEESVKKAVATLKSDFEYFGEEFCIIDVTNWMLPYFEKSGVKFEVDDRRDLMDYVFTPEMFLAGMEKQDDRYRCRYFMRKNNYEVVEITPEHADEIRELMERIWCEGLSCSHCHYGCLSNVVVTLAKVFDKLRVHGLLVRVDAKAVGFTMCSVKRDFCVFQYKNADNRIKGLNEFLLRETFERYMGGVTEINYTEDIGLENLRRYKMNMAPEFKLSSKMILTAKG